MDRTSGQWWAIDGEMATLPLEAVRSRAIELLYAAGAKTADAAFISDVHLDKALQGDHERGVAMLVGQIRLALAGAIDLRAPVRVLRDQGATALVGAVHRRATSWYAVTPWRWQSARPGN